MINRYVIQFKNSHYVNATWDIVLDKMLIKEVVLPIDGTLFQTKKQAEKYLDELIKGNKTQLHLHDSEPERIIKLKISVSV